MTAETTTQEQLAEAEAPEQAAKPTAPPTVGRPHFSRDSLGSGFRALQVPNYRLFWIGQLISLTGSWMQTTAQAWLVIQLTNSPFALGLVTTFQFLPIMLPSLIGGTISDRFPKHRLILITQSAALIQAAVFGTLVATGAIQIWHVYILAAIQGIINAIDTPSRQAFVPELVGKKYLVNAIALNSMLFNGARVVGPAVAGLLIANIGIAPALFINAISFIAVIGSLLMMNTKNLYQAASRSSGAIIERLLEGLRYVWQTPKVMLVMILMAAIGTFGYNFTVVLPLVAGFVLKTGPEGLGQLSAFLGVGSLIAALSTAYTKQVTQTRLIVGATAFSIIFAATALSTNFLLTLALLVGLGFAGILFTTAANTLIQLSVPDELRGRVISIYFLLFAGSTPIGGFVIGTLSSAFGVSVALLFCAAMCLVGVGIALLYRRRFAS